MRAGVLGAYETALPEEQDISGVMEHEKGHTHSMNLIDFACSSRKIVQCTEHSRPLQLLTTFAHLQLEAWR